MCGRTTGWKSPEIDVKTAYRLHDIRLGSRAEMNLPVNLVACSNAAIAGSAPLAFRRVRVSQSPLEQARTF